ncbi:DNA-binding protein [Streptomyces sp. NPDC096030]|uniref:DNA-binding protein n=1 Tax=Streptomyces sp. NPDC096030 TaxID=3155423 RepID=UPI00331EDB80
MRPALATAEDAAYWAGRSVGTIWRWASEGRISRYGTGKRTWYDVREIPRADRDECTKELIAPGRVPPMPARAKAA